MASTINATTTGSGGLITTGNSVNQLELQTGDTTRLVIDGSGNVTIQGQGDLRLADSDSSHYVALQAAGTMASNVTFTLPSTDGTSGQVLQTNGSGTLSFATPSGGITSITAGSGLSGGTITTSGTISINTNNSVGVGAYAFVFTSASSGTVSDGSTTAGSNLNPAGTSNGSFGPDTSITLSGTWRNVSGRTAAGGGNGYGLFIRTA